MVVDILSVAGRRGRLIMTDRVAGQHGRTAVPGSDIRLGA